MKFFNWAMIIIYFMITFLILYWASPLLLAILKIKGSDFFIMLPFLMIILIVATIPFIYMIRSILRIIINNQYGKFFYCEKALHKIEFITDKFLLYKNKIAISLFLWFWFSIIIWVAYSQIQEKNYEILLFLIPFFLFGILIIKTELFKK